MLYCASKTGIYNNIIIIYDLEYHGADPELLGSVTSSRRRWVKIINRSVKVKKVPVSTKNGDGIGFQDGWRDT